MPRDANGNYTLPAGNPVTPGTTIETNWANPTMSDIATAITDSLSRTGQGGMVVPFKNADGSVSLPGMTFTNGQNTGFYRDATQIAVSYLGVQRMAWKVDGAYIGASKVATIADLSGNEGFAIAMAIALG